jgi:DNA-binding response OmpR family regulator
VGYVNVLIVEDYPKINHLLAMFLRNDGHKAKQVFDAEHAIEAIKYENFDVILLDLMLPHMQGEALIQHIREVSDVYIIVLSAKIDVKDRIDVIKIGADDYITKPFSIDEVMAKLHNVNKRISIHQPTVYSFNHGHLKIVALSREVFVKGQLINLTKYEYDVLFHLMSHPQIVFTRDMIIESCFIDSEAYDRVIDVFIKNIRKKIDSHLEKSYIKTHYGVGYQFVGDLDE